jgi:hypothetical protein
MAAALYRDYIVDLKARIDDLHTNTESYQSYALTMELLAQKNLVSYSAKKAKGQTEGLSYRRDFTTGQAVRMQQESAYALHFDYRRKGQPKTASTRMHFVGLNGEAEATSYEQTARTDSLVLRRPFASALFWEWK